MASFFSGREDRMDKVQFGCPGDEAMVSLVQGYLGSEKRRNWRFAVVVALVAGKLGTDPYDAVDNLRRLQRAGRIPRFGHHRESESARGASRKRPARLPWAELRELAVAARREGRDRAWLVAEVVRRWGAARSTVDNKLRVLASEGLVDPPTPRGVCSDREKVRRRVAELRAVLGEGSSGRSTDVIFLEDRWRPPWRVREGDPTAS